MRAVVLQEAEEPRVLLFLRGGAAPAGVRALRQGQVHGQDGGLRGAPPRRLRHGPRYGGSYAPSAAFVTLIIDISTSGILVKNA